MTILSDARREQRVAAIILNLVVDYRGPVDILNHMVEQSAAALDRVFRALASAPRREILRRTAREKCTVTELAAHFEMSLAAVSKHIRVLDEAELLVETREGRLHWRRFNPTALEAAASSIEELRAFWTKQLDGLERFLLESPPETVGARPPKRKPSSRRRR